MAATRSPMELVPSMITAGDYIPQALDMATRCTFLIWIPTDQVSRFLWSMKVRLCMDQPELNFVMPGPALLSGAFRERTPMLAGEWRWISIHVSAAMRRGLRVAHS